MCFEFHTIEVNADPYVEIASYRVYSVIQNVDALWNAKILINASACKQIGHVEMSQAPTLQYVSLPCASKLLIWCWLKQVASYTDRIGRLLSLAFVQIRL